MKKRIMPAVHCVWLSVTLSGPSIVQAQSNQGSIVGWGSQVVGVDLSSGFVAVAAGASHSLGLKADGSIVAWGYNDSGQTNVPAPNTGFVAGAAGFIYGLSRRAVPGVRSR